MNKQLLSFITLNKRFIIPIALSLSSLFMLFFIIIPQISSISETLSQLSEQRSEVLTLTQSLFTINSQPDDQLDENFVLTTDALPTEKRVAMIFSALTSAAQKSNSNLEEFSLTIGGIYGRAALVTTTVSGSPSVGVVAKVSGADAVNLVDFAREIQKTLPLSEVTKISISSGDGIFEIGFFYKPFDTAKTQEQDKVAPLSQSDSSLINQLREWNQQ